MELNKKFLINTYFNPAKAGSFGSFKSLYNEIKKKYPKITKSQVQDWLDQQNTYSLFKKVIRKFPRLKTLTGHIDEQWQADLMDVSWFARYNKGVKYLLVVIDIFTRYAWVMPIKDKSAKSVTNAMKKILEGGRIPDKLQTDQGKEFKNSTFKGLMNDYDINFFTTTDDAVKCALVERLNRTLRSRIYRFMYHNNTNKFIDNIQQIVKGYNQTYHRSIKTSPSEVNNDNEARILYNQREIPSENVVDKFKDVVFVRIAKKKNIFGKGATTNWTDEIFKIVYRKKTPNTYIYKLEDLHGESITSIFYPNELSPAIINIKKRGRKKKQK